MRIALLAGAVAVVVLVAVVVVGLRLTGDDEPDWAAEATAACERALGRGRDLAVSGAAIRPVERQVVEVFAGSTDIEADLLSELEALPRPPADAEEVDLRAIEAPTVTPPEGVEIVTWAERPGVEEAMYEVARETYPDVPGEEDAEVAPFEEWLSMDMQGVGDRPEATFLALADGEVVAYAKLALSLARPTVAMHDMTGVRRAWRGRGIAGALKAAEIAWAKEQGYERLETQNEERNEPIRRLNERYGYVVEPGSVTVRGPRSTG